MAVNKVDKNTILKAVDVLVNKRIDEAGLDKTIIATVEKQISPAQDGAHRVKYNGGTFTAYSASKTAYPINSSVYVQIPQGNFSKRKFILGSASYYYVENNAQMTSSAINDYSIVGTNVLEWNTEPIDYQEEYENNGFGLNSYTVTKEDSNYQDSLLLYDRQWSKDKLSPFILNITNLKTYLNEAKAVMLSADFRITLTQEQQMQSQAEYGLVFDLVFKNEAAAYNTHGDLFNAVAGDIVIPDENDEEQSMEKFNQDVKNVIDDVMKSNITEWENLIIKLEGLLAGIINFINVGSAQLTSQQQAIFNSYKMLIYELRQLSSDKEEDVTISEEDKNKLNDKYDEWFATPLDIIIDKSPHKTLSYTLDSSHMTGSPFSYSNYVTQYVIFPIDKENFEYIDKIYFYCKGFQQNEDQQEFIAENRLKMRERERVWDEEKKEYIDTDTYSGKDIWVKNIQFLVLKELNSQYGDYKIQVETPQGSIFRSLDDTVLECQAQVRYKEWNYINDDCAFYWFKQDKRVASVTDENYNIYGGIGWKYLGQNKIQQTDKIEIKASDNRAYENIYKCVAVYSKAEEGQIWLTETFTLYNEVCKRSIEITSSLGIKASDGSISFKFDTGTPELTCLIDGKDMGFDPNKDDSQFKFYWTKRTVEGDTFSFQYTYEQVEEKIKNNTDYKIREQWTTIRNQLKGVKYKNEDLYSNGLIYPIENDRSESKVIFECQVYTTDVTNEETLSKDDWYSIGSASLILKNEGVAQLNEYTIYIENGNQVFQYSERGVSPTVGTAITPTDFRHNEPIEVLPLSMKFFDPNGVEVGSGTYAVKWKYPTENSLIIPPETITDLSLTDTITAQTAEFDIAKNYDYTCINNQIECIVEYNGKKYSKLTDFYFGKIGDNGTNGTDIVAKIVCENILSSDQMLTGYIYGKKSNRQTTWNTEGLPKLKLEIYNRSEKIWDSKENEDNSTILKWSILGGSTDSASYLQIEESKDKRYGELKFRDAVTSSENPIEKPNLIIKAECQMRIESELENESEKDKDRKTQTYYAFYPVSIVWTKYQGLPSELTPLSNPIIYVDNKKILKQILYGPDGRNPVYATNQGIKICGLNGRQTDWAVYGDANLKIMKNSSDVASAQKILKETTGIDEIFISPPVKYDGSSCNNGVNVTVYTPTSSGGVEKIYNNLTQGVKDKLTIYTNIVKEFTKTFKQATNKYETETKDLEELREWYSAEPSDRAKWDKKLEIRSKVLLKQYFTEEELEGKTDHEIVGEIDGKIKNSQDIYTDASTTFEKGISKAEDDKNNAIEEIQRKAVTETEEYNCTEVNIYVPIYMALNIYSLSALNAWDGNSIDINEAGGSILAPQIGAGYKNSNNAFTGIVMGDFREEEDSKVGLLGFHEGQQSIFLDANTGDAIFGLPNPKSTDKEEVREYSEGQIELKPYGVSTIGGWRLGRRALYYTESGDIGSGYTDDYAKNHEKDINHNDNGILLSANNYVWSADEKKKKLWGNPYLSIKGRELKDGDVSTEVGTNIFKGDSLELQLDPSQRSIFSIFVHRKKANKDNEYDRILLSGIDNKGRFIANRLQNGNSTNTSNSSTSFEVSDVYAFGDKSESPSYIGAQFEAGKSVDKTKTFISLFAEKDTVTDNNGPIYITGGEHSGNDYARPISIHGKSVSLYAFSDALTATAKTTNSKIVIDSDNAYIGTANNHLQLGTNELKTKEGFSISNTGSNLTIFNKESENSPGKTQIGNYGYNSTIYYGSENKATKGDVYTKIEETGNYRVRVPKDNNIDLYTYDDDDTVNAKIAQIFANKDKVILKNSQSSLTFEDSSITLNNSNGFLKIEKSQKVTLSNKKSPYSAKLILDENKITLQPYSNTNLVWSKDSGYVLNANTFIKLNSGEGETPGRIELNANGGVDSIWMEPHNITITTQFLSLNGGGGMITPLRLGTNSAGDFIPNIELNNNGHILIKKDGNVNLRMYNSGNICIGGDLKTLSDPAPKIRLWPTGLIQIGRIKSITQSGEDTIPITLDGRDGTNLGTISTIGDVRAKKDGKWITLKGHTHDFSKGVTVRVQQIQSGSPTASITQGGVGSNAVITVGVSANATASCSGAKIAENQTFQFRVRKFEDDYKVFSLRVYPDGTVGVTQDSRQFITLINNPTIIEMENGEITIDNITINTYGSPSVTVEGTTSLPN